MTDVDVHSLEGASDGHASWAIPVSSRPHLASLPPSFHPAIRTSRVGDFPRRHLSEDLIHHQPSTRPQATTSRGWLTVAATISIAYLVFLSQSGPWGRVLAKSLDCPDRVSSHQSASGNVGFGNFLSLIRNIQACGWCTRPVRAASRSHPGRPRAIVGSRSSGVPGRPGPGTGGSSQKVC